MEIEVFVQGSYKNNTNVREDSDVDICVCLMRPFFTDFSMAEGITRRDAGLSDSNYTYLEFKNEVGAALVSKFGRDGVTRSDKAFDVHENSYRVDADVVACLEHRQYTRRETEGNDETAEALDIAPRTAKYFWTHARAWLYREIALPQDE